MEQSKGSGPPGEYPGHPTMDENFDGPGGPPINWGENNYDLDDHQSLSGPEPTLHSPESGASFDPYKYLSNEQDDHHILDDHLPLGVDHSPPEHTYLEYPHDRTYNDHQQFVDEPGAQSNLGAYDYTHPGEQNIHHAEHQRSVDEPYEGYQYLDKTDVNSPPQLPTAQAPKSHRSDLREDDSRNSSSKVYDYQHRERDPSYRELQHMENRDRIRNHPPLYREKESYSSRRPDEEEWYDRPRQRVSRSDGSPPRRRQYVDSHPNGPQVQVSSAAQPPPAPPAAAPPATAPNMGETMQMMVMSQMMQQQMQAQQMQAAQMANMMGQKSQGGESSCGGGSCRSKKKGQRSTLVNIKGGGKRRRVIKKALDSKPAVVVRKVAVPIMQPILQPPPSVSGDEESGGFENWQEATIILCLMIVGLIYLVSSRASAPPPDEKKPSRHLAGAS